MGLNIRRKGKRRIPARVKEPLHQTSKINEIWSMDFMSDSLINGRRFRTLNIMDDYYRRAIAMEAAYCFPSVGVINVLEKVMEVQGKPAKIRVDNGPEFTSHEFKVWCKAKKIKLQFIQPGRPMQNAFIERLNRTFRQDVLDAYLFDDIYQVRDLAEEWIEDYNQHRPHESLGGMTPEGYKKRCLKKEKLMLN